MRVIIIGGKGHVGTYLVPRLVEAGHEVACISRGQREPYLPHAAWKWVQQITLDREREEANGAFGVHVRDLKPDVVIDMICFTLDSCRHLVEALRGHVQHFLHCGTIWVHGPSARVPTTEEEPRRPFGEYGIQKAAIEVYLLNEARRNGFPATALHPGHIVGQGWVPLNPAGHFNPQVFAQIARGEELCLPNIGLETVHHVHADDVAQSFMQAMANWGNAVGESFHVVSPQALSLRGYAEAMYAWFGHEPRLRYLPWEDWRKTVSEDEARDVGSHRAQPELQHHQGTTIAELSAALQLAASGAAVGGLADRTWAIILHMKSYVRLVVMLACCAGLIACTSASGAQSARPTASVATLTPLPADYPQLLRDDISIRKVAEVGPGMMRLVKDPGSNDLYYLTPTGDVYYLSPQSDGETTGTLAYSHREIGGADYTMGLAFGSDRILYVSGNENQESRNRCVIRKGVISGSGRKWSTLAMTDWYPKSDTQYDHLCNGIVVSPDGKHVFFNSGSRTEHGEVQDADGKFPNTREAPLTSAIFRVPANAQGLLLSNDEAKLKAGGYLYADGLRNSFDLAFAANGDLFGVENGPDADLPDEMNWLRESKHYGFPWRFGDEDNPQQFADYDPKKDKRLSMDFLAVKEGMYANDPTFPKPPMAFTDPVINLGPDGDQFRAADGSQKDASDLGQPAYSFTPHRSPLGLTFDLDNRLSGDYKGAAFLLSWGAAGGTLTDAGQDLLLLKLTKKGDNYQMTATQIAKGFDRPIDSALIGDKLYVLDNGGEGAIWEISLP